MVKKKVKREEFVLKKTKDPELRKDLGESYEIAYDFATKTYQRFQELIKAIALFGSVAKQSVTHTSDIDLLVIIDDCTVQWDNELIAWYRGELATLIAQQEYKNKIHVNTITLTSFWEEVKAGEPVAINVLRYGEPLIDFGGFFEPFKVLLAKGRIRPTPEAVFTTMKRSYDHYHAGRAHLFAIIEEYYWSALDAAHAALMAEGEVPPSPEHVAKFLEDVFVKTKRLDKRYVHYYEDLRELSKKIVHRELKDIDGRMIDNAREKTEKFVKTLTQLTKILIRHEKIIKVEKRT